MSFLDRFRRKKNYLPSRSWNALLSGDGVWMQNAWNKRLIIEQAYQRNAPFYSAVNILTQAIVEMPIEVEYESNGKIGVTDRHPILNMLERGCTRQEFIERYVMYYLVTGETFAEIVWSSDNRPLGLISLPSQNMVVVQGDEYRPIKKYIYNGTKQVPFMPESIVHLYRPSLSNYFESLSPAIPLQELIALQNSAVTWNKNVAQQGGVPPIIAIAEGLDKSDAERLRKDWESQSGSNNSHRLKFVGAQLKLEKMNMTPHDAEWGDAILTSMRMIFMAMGVSSSLMNDAGNKTYNNVHDSRKALYNEGAIPIAKRVYSSITQKLSKYYADNPRIRVKTDSILAIQEDRKDTIERLVSAVQAGIMSANEARKELGLPKKSEDGADDLKRTGSSAPPPQPNVIPNG
jgi:HK97 family phage portal protein